MFVDIHSHILPSVDDGASDAGMALEMLKMASIGGTAHIVATPHYAAGSFECTPSLVYEKCGWLQNLANEAGIDITIHSGSEVFICHDIPELFDNGSILALSGTAYILLELPFDCIPLYTDKVLYNLQLKGLIPIIAHPERNREIIRNPGILAEFAHRGILAQANSGSITGLYGRKIRRAVLEFIRMGFIQFVASDAHSCGRRSACLVKASEIIRRKFGSDMVDRLFCSNGINILESKYIKGGAYYED